MADKRGRTRVSTILSRARAILNDGARACEGNTQTFAHWGNDLLISYLNEAIDLMVSLRPDAFTATVKLTLTPGSQQSLPYDYDALVDVLANTDGSGSAVSLVNETSDDTTRIAPSRCGTETTSAGDCAPGAFEVRSFQRFPQSQTEFSVSPAVPVGQNVSVLARVVKRPLPLCQDNEGISLAPKFNAALVHWVVYRAFSKDIESAFASAIAAKHYGWFYEGLEYQRLAESRFRSGYYLGMVGDNDPQARNR